LPNYSESRILRIDNICFRLWILFIFIKYLRAAKYLRKGSEKFIAETMGTDYRFGRATLLGYGGGPSIVPLYQHEAVEVFKWVTKDEFGQALAFGNACRVL